MENSEAAVFLGPAPAWARLAVRLNKPRPWRDKSRHSRVCNDIHAFVTTRALFIPYTYPTMALDAPLSIEKSPGKAPGTLILRLSGPVTLRNLFDLQAQLREIEIPKLTILDLTNVPYMDSAGMGAVVNHYVRCESKGARLIAVGVSPRIQELFKITRVDSVIPQAATVEEAEAGL
jgi:anti-anti-sigma factor